MQGLSNVCKNLYVVGIPFRVALNPEGALEETIVTVPAYSDLNNIQLGVIYEMGGTMMHPHKFEIKCKGWMNDDKR